MAASKSIALLSRMNRFRVTASVLLFIVAIAGAQDQAQDPSEPIDGVIEIGEELE